VVGEDTCPLCVLEGEKGPLIGGAVVSSIKGGLLEKGPDLIERRSPSAGGGGKGGRSLFRRWRFLPGKP